MATPGHLFVTQLAHAANVQLNHIPFKGSVDVVMSGVKGDVPVITDGTHLVLQQVAAGRLRVLSVMAPRRLAVLPEVPTLAESRFCWHRPPGLARCVCAGRPAASGVGTAASGLGQGQPAA